MTRGSGITRSHSSGSGGGRGEDSVVLVFKGCGFPVIWMLCGCSKYISYQSSRSLRFRALRLSLRTPPGGDPSHPMHFSAST